MFCIAEFLFLLVALVPAYCRVLMESGASLEGNEVVEADEDVPSRWLAMVHDPTEKEMLIHRYSESVLQVTKDLISFSPRSGDYNSSVEAGLTRLRRLHPRAAGNVLRGRGVAVPHHQILPSCDHALHYRTMDGVCNNLQHPCWGKADEPYQRWLSPSYGNGIDSIRRRADGHLLPSPRLVYQWVSSQQQQSSNSTLPKLSSLVTMWGQMVAHDVVMTPTVTVKGVDGKERALQCCPHNKHSDCIPIKLNYEDGFYEMNHCMDISRSAAHVYSPSSCTPPTLGNPREQMNQLTSFLDASLVYGSSEEDMRGIRENGGRGAKLKVDAWGCPIRKERECKTSHKVCDKRCFHAGEKRANENPVLAAIHVVWIREHNRLVDSLASRGWDQETLFHVARKMVGALMQHITYSEYLPTILGSHLVDSFKLRTPTRDGYHYNPNDNPTIFNVFSTAAFRYGHSMIDSRLMREGRGYSGAPPLSQDFFSMDDFCDPHTDPIAPLLAGQAAQRPQSVDCTFSKQVTQHLFSRDVNGVGLDLFSVNIQRGRDHGLPPYTQWRDACSITPQVRDYRDLQSDIPRHILERLQAIYGPGGVHEVDLYVGGISEFPVNDGILGRTFTCIVANQFRKLKFGDRFWYENTQHQGALTHDQILEIQKTTLAGLLCRNSDIRDIQRNAFQSASENNPKVSCDFIQRETYLDTHFW